MTRRTVAIAAIMISLILVPETVRAQRLIDRFAPSTGLAPRIIGGVLMGVAGAVVGGIPGASISRGEDPAAPEPCRRRILEDAGLVER